MEYEMSEAMQHFEEEYRFDASQALKEKILKYIKEHRAELTAEFVANFRQLCQKIKKMQEAGEKGKIAYLTYSFGVDNLQRESQAYQVEAYGTEWFYEEGAACRISYDVSWLYALQEEMYQELLQISKQYIGKITSADMAHVWKREVLHSDVRLLEFAKKAIREAVLIEEFQMIAKEEVLEIWLGEYKGYSEIIKKFDTRVKDARLIKSWLQEQRDEYSYSILHHLDLSEGNYAEIPCHYTEFLGSNLTKANFEKASLIGSSFVKTVLTGANFQEAVLSLTDFRETLLEEVNMEKARLREAEFQNCQLVRVNLTKAECYDADFSNCVFRDCLLKGIDFSYANLTGVNLEKQKLNQADFIRTNLAGANLVEADLREAEFIKTMLSGADLTGADLTGAKFRNFDFTQGFNFAGAKFGDNQFDGEVRIYAKDLGCLNLSAEDRQKLTVLK